jgi:ketosteroid isomerase-like protein
MADESKVHEIVKRYFEYVGADVERADEIYHEDAVLEFPQSGERFEGVATFTEWRRRYPADLDKVRFKLRRVTVRPDLAVVELTASYDGESWLQGVQLLEFRGDKVARDGIYVTEAMEAPEWRAHWR